MRAIDAGILICKECHELNRQEADTEMSKSVHAAERWCMPAARIAWCEPGHC
ncbi:hypothetical protein ABIA48_003798 [Pseudomonas sp. S30_BP2TU TE3576]